jgi:flagellar hook-associated protein 3 FlgL
MSGISLATDLGTFATTIYNTRQTNASISALTEEATTGYVSSTYDGLGGVAGQALDLNSALALNAASQTNASLAATQSQVAQTALGQIETLASNFASQLLEPSAATATGLSTLAASAQSTLQQVASLLNTKVGDTYIFAGQDSSNPPIPNPDSLSSSAFYQAVQTAVSGLDTNGAAGTFAALLGVAGPGATSPFSATLEASNQPATADLGSGQTVQTSVLADQNSNAISTGTGTTSTGSYTRDILLSLATVAALGGANNTDPQVQTLLSNTQSTLANASVTLNTDIGALGARQQQITNAQSDLTATATALTTQLGNVQNADQASVATQLSNAENQLQASYKIIGALEQLSLAKYI